MDVMNTSRPIAASFSLKTSVPRKMGRGDCVKTLSPSATVGVASMKRNPPLSAQSHSDALQLVMEMDPPLERESIAAPPDTLDLLTHFWNVVLVTFTSDVDDPMPQRTAGGEEEESTEMLVNVQPVSVSEGEMLLDCAVLERREAEEDGVVMNEAKREMSRMTQLERLTTEADCEIARGMTPLVKRIEEMVRSEAVKTPAETERRE